MIGVTLCFILEATRHSSARNTARLFYHRRMPTRHLGLGVALFLATVGGVRQPLAVGQWQPAAGPLTTRWAKDVTPDRGLA